MDLLNGEWHQVETKEQFDQLLRYGEIGVDDNTNSRRRSDYVEGYFQGEGNYLLLDVQKKCPRGCCFDYGRRFLSAKEATKLASAVHKKWVDFVMLCLHKQDLPK